MVYEVEVEDDMMYANLHPCWLHFLAYLGNFMWKKYRSHGIIMMDEDVSLCTPENPVALNPMELSWTDLRSIIDDPARAYTFQ